MIHHVKRPVRLGPQYPVHVDGDQKSDPYRQPGDNDECENPQGANPRRPAPAFRHLMPGHQGHKHQAADEKAKCGRIQEQLPCGPQPLDLSHGVHGDFRAVGRGVDGQ